GVPKANHAFMHAFTGVFLYTNGVGVNSALSTVQVSYDLRERTGRSQIPRFSLYTDTLRTIRQYQPNKGAQRMLS
ncbi:MAG: hypothetical protein K2G76_04335, partial [Prevotella sp.]|nr:hypothetical protein [Prevotella sp.]